MNELSAVALAIAWTQALVALALVLQTLELLWLWRFWSDAGIWRYAVLAPEHRLLGPPLRGLCALSLPARSFGVLLCVRLLAALALGAGYSSGLGPLLLFTQVAICVRFRGTFNGGSDTFSVVLLTGLTLAQLFPGSLLAQKAALLYIAVQLSLTYFISGMAKLQHADWRSGRALANFLGSGRYGTPAGLVRVFSGPLRLSLVSWLVLVFECCFPLAWSGPRTCLAFIGLGLCFHLGTWLLFGLNRFVFAWAAAYPALYWCSQWIH